MKKWTLLFAVCGLLLTGCAHVYKEACGQCALEGFDPRVVRAPNPLLPNVFVMSGKFLTVDQEPIRINRRDVGSDGRVTVSWALPAGSPYTFSTKAKKDRDGIEFSAADRASVRGAPADLDRASVRGAPVDLKCGIQGPQEKVFQCTFTVPEGKYQYKYTVYVLRGDELLEPLDPDVVGAY